MAIPSSKFYNLSTIQAITTPPQKKIKIESNSSKKFLARQYEKVDCRESIFPKPGIFFFCYINYILHILAFKPIYYCM